MGQSPDSNTYNDKTGIEFHQGKGHFTEYLIDNSNIYTSKPQKIAPKNSIIMSVRAPVGDINLVNREICIGRGLCSIIPDKNINLKYIFIYLWLNKKLFEKQSTGTTFKAINKDVICNFEVLLPPLEEQNRILIKLNKIIKFFNFTYNS